MQCYLFLIVLYSEKLLYQRDNVMEYLQVPFEFDTKAHTEEDDTMFNVSGYASTFKNTDLVNDIVMPGAFANSLAAKNGKKIKILWQHNVTMPIGKVTLIKEDEKGLFIKASLPKAHSMAADVITLIKSGIIDSMSIGFTINDAEFAKNDKRKLKDLTLHEISFVTIPANPKATVTSFKNLETTEILTVASRDSKWNEVNAENRVALFTENTKNYQEAFLCPIPGVHNNNQQQSFDCKLLFVDVIDNQLQVIPKALFRITALLKGDLVDDIPEQYFIPIKDLICTYYKKMGLTDPFESKKFHSLELEMLTKRELEKILRDSGLCLSKSAATHFVSCVDWNSQPSDSDDTMKQEEINFVYSSIVNMTEIIKNGY